MPVQRQLFEISTDTGTYGDTGVPTWGSILQMRWVPTTADTGADLQIALLPKQGDTGDGWLFVDDTDCLGVQFTRVPFQQRYGADGSSDTGNDVPVIAAGDRLRVKVIPGGAACAGRLYVWSWNGS